MNTMPRSELIGAIRDRVESLYAVGRFAIVREILQDIDRYNFTDVSDKALLRVWNGLQSVPATPED